jgi:hypothetical protein
VRFSIRLNRKWSVAKSRQVLGSNFVHDTPIPTNVKADWLALLSLFCSERGLGQPFGEPQSIGRADRKLDCSPRKGRLSASRKDQEHLWLSEWPPECDEPDHQRLRQSAARRRLALLASAIEASSSVALEKVGGHF